MLRARIPLPGFPVRHRLPADADRRRDLGERDARATPKSAADWRRRKLTCGAHPVAQRVNSWHVANMSAESCEIKKCLELQDKSPFANIPAVS